jgi:uncharacterized phiE125 gp8 family phage protein
VGAIRYNLTLVTEPDVEPLTVAQVVEYLKIATPTAESEEESLLESFIVAAREIGEGRQHRAYITQTWRMTLPDGFPCGAIQIPKGNLQSVDEIKYTDSDGDETTLTEGTDYIVTTDGILGKIAPPYAGTWPTATLWPLNPVSITFTCGYGDDATSIPHLTMVAMKMLISHWHENRMVSVIGTTADELPFSVKALLNLNTIWVV